MRKQMILWLPAIVLSAGIGFLGCQTESSGPAIGSAEWYWQAAQHNYAVGDYEKAEEHLDNLVSMYSDWRERAVPWRAAVSGGLARGYLELTDTFGLCASMNAKAADDLQNPIQQWRRDARRHALIFVESATRLAQMAQQNDSLELDFAFPPGRPIKSPLIENIEEGMAPRPDQIADCEDEALGRGLVLQTSMIAGVDGDTPQAQKLFETPPVTVPANKLLCSVAESLVDLSTVFDPRHVNETDKQAYMLDLAVKTLESPLSCDDAEVRQKAEEIQKKAAEQRKTVS